TRTFVSFHRQRLLLHPVLPSLSTPLYNAPSSYAVDLISNALKYFREYCGKGQCARQSVDRCPRCLVFVFLSGFALMPLGWAKPDE
ncbi:hypothetical protein, partial [Paraburkholderia sp. EG304]|uniref:hypothetical protein n=1 Tax=Paraburkholderia sp. EG304 TaxID=3237015 RepID=UPI00397ABAD5